MGVLFEVDLKDMWGDFEVDGETVEVVAVPGGEVLQFVVVDEEFCGEPVGAFLLALVEVVVSGFWSLYTACPSSWASVDL